MIWWPIVKPVTFMSSEILVTLPFSLGEKVAGKARRMRRTAPNASSPLGKGRGEASEFGPRRLANGAKRNGG
jgi:hypothetical protein